jgi:hypothetical protein
VTLGHVQVGDKLQYMSGSVQMLPCHWVQGTLQPYLFELQRMSHIRESHNETGNTNIINTHSQTLQKQTKFKCIFMCGLYIKKFLS